MTRTEPREAPEWTCPECGEDAHGARCPHCGHSQEDPNG